MSSKNKQQTKEKSRKKRKGLLSFFKDERFKVSMGGFLLIFALFLTLSFISYFFTWKSDQSFFDEQKVISGAEVQVENWAGKAGAYFAHNFLYKGFGLPSFSVPFLLFLIGFRFLNIRILPLGKTFRMTITAAVILSVILGYLFENSASILGYGPGGVHGYEMAAWLNAFIGKAGTGFFLGIAVFIYLIFSFESISVIMKRELKQLFYGKKPATQTTTADREESSPEPASTETEEAHPTTVFKTDNKEEKTAAQEDEDMKLTVRHKKEDEDITTGHGTSQQIKDYDPTLDLPSYQLPPLNLLEEHRSDSSNVTKEELVNNKNRIVETLGNYKIRIDKITATIGPTITLYEIVPAPGIRISKIKNLEDDIALSLAALGIRIIAPIPGRGTIGIEVPNLNPETVSMRSIIGSAKFRDTKYDLPLALGKTISNEPYVVDLTRMPHLLVAGATGQGKSVGLNAIITSLLYKKHPAQLKFVLIDPKKVELTVYSKIENHHLAKLPDTEEAIITDTQKVIHTLNSLTIEMDQRYTLLKEAHVRNIKEYNNKFISRRLNPQKGHRYMPYIVLIIDEFADLIMTAGREIEAPLARLAQLARAVGIHLVIATQRPTTNIITGMIKANFPSRIAFRVTSMMDSRTILDTPGANQLIGRGDMLITSGSDLIRLQCAFIDTGEIDKITGHISSQKGYDGPHLLPEYVDESSSERGEADLNKRDEIFEEAARLVVQNQQGSTSLIQRKFSIGYNRAGRIVDQLEAAGIVGPFEGSKARQVLVNDEYTLEQLLNELSTTNRQ